MSGADGSSAGASGLQGLLDRFKSSGQASQFSADGSAPSQFTMPGGNIPQFQGTQMLPATLGGVQGVADAQNWTQAVQNAGSSPDWSKLAGIGAALQQPGQDAQMPRAPAGARGGGGQSMSFTPQQMQNTPAGPTQGMVNLQNPVNATLGPTQSVQNLMQLLKLGNAGFTTRLGQ